VIYVFLLDVTLDQRGRLYCSSGLFNCQSNQLSRALLLFANPGTIQKTDTNSIMYLKESIWNELSW